MDGASDLRRGRRASSIASIPSACGAPADDTEGTSGYAPGLIRKIPTVVFDKAAELDGPSAYPTTDATADSASGITKFDVSTQTDYRYFAEKVPRKYCPLIEEFQDAIGYRDDQLRTISALSRNAPNFITYAEPRLDLPPLPPGFDIMLAYCPFIKERMEVNVIRWNTVLCLTPFKDIDMYLMYKGLLEENDPYEYTDDEEESSVVADSDYGSVM